jgi:predicted phosphodiesterase
MGVTRLEFIKGALVSLGFGAFGGRRLFAAPKGWKPEKPANLVFGVLSDTHLRTAVKGVRPGRNWSPRYFAAAMEYFASRNVDAVVHCGDFAHRGQVEEMQYHANYWNKFFPGGMAPGGHRVEKLFVTGNHDVDGSGYYGFCTKKYPDPDERAKHVLSTDLAANWERIWGEKYEPLWHKEIKGYHFFGRNWAEDGMEFAKMINAQADKSGFKASSKPFFVLTHRRPLAALRKSIARNPNAISFFGHNHWSNANWNTAYLYKGGLVAIQCASCEPRGCNALVGDDWITKAKIEGLDKAGRGRQGFVVRVYDDMIVFERHEFSDGETSLGPDWVMPFDREEGKGKRPHPLSREERKKAIGEPQFREGAKLIVEDVSTGLTGLTGLSGAKPQTSDNLVNPVNPVQENPASPKLRVRIPLADGNPDSRVYAYEVEVTGDEGTPKLYKAVYAAGCNMGIGHETNGGVTTLEIAKDELPPGKTLTIAARPLSSLGTKGKAIAAEWKI